MSDSSLDLHERDGGGVSQTYSRKAYLSKVSSRQYDAGPESREAYPSKVSSRQYDAGPGSREAYPSKVSSRQYDAGPGSREASAGSYISGGRSQFTRRHDGLDHVMAGCLDTGQPASSHPGLSAHLSARLSGPSGSHQHGVPTHLLASPGSDTSQQCGVATYLPPSLRPVQSARSGSYPYPGPGGSTMMVRSTEGYYEHYQPPQQISPQKAREIKYSRADINVRDKVAKLLQVSRRWEHLASHLGFEPVDIQVLTDYAHARSMTETQYIFSQHMCSGDSAYDILMALVHMKEKHCLQILQQHFPEFDLSEYVTDDDMELELQLRSPTHLSVRGEDQPAPSMMNDPNFHTPPGGDVVQDATVDSSMPESNHKQPHKQCKPYGFSILNPSQLRGIHQPMDLNESESMFVNCNTDSLPNSEDIEMTGIYSSQSVSRVKEVPVPVAEGIARQQFQYPTISAQLNSVIIPPENMDVGAEETVATSRDRIENEPINLITRQSDAPKHGCQNSDEIASKRNKNFMEKIISAVDESMVNSLKKECEENSMDSGEVGVGPVMIEPVRETVIHSRFKQTPTLNQYVLGGEGSPLMPVSQNSPLPTRPQPQEHSQDEDMYAYQQISPPGGAVGAYETVDSYQSSSRYQNKEHIPVSQNYSTHKPAPQATWARSNETTTNFKGEIHHNGYHRPKHNHYHGNMDDSHIPHHHRHQSPHGGARPKLHSRLTPGRPSTSQGHPPGEEKRRHPQQHKHHGLRQQMPSNCGRDSRPMDRYNTVPKMRSQTPPRSVQMFSSAPASFHLAQSEPQVQYAEFKEAARQTRVLITYSNDNKRHMAQVLQFAKYLRTQEFRVTIDKAEQKQMDQDIHGWLDTRFKQVDFVLICISPQYKEDADASLLEPDDTNSLNEIERNPHRCRTRYLHRLMQSEYTSKGCKNERFRPILFPETNYKVCYIPTWLLNTTVYHWPGHWKDLCFHLTKPHEAMKDYMNGSPSSSRSNSRPNSRSNSVPSSPGECSPRVKSIISTNNDHKNPVIVKKRSGTQHSSM